MYVRVHAQYILVQVREPQRNRQQRLPWKIGPSSHQDRISDFGFRISALEVRFAVNEIVKLPESRQTGGESSSDGLGRCACRQRICLAAWLRRRMNGLRARRGCRYQNSGRSQETLCFPHLTSIPICPTTNYEHSTEHAGIPYRSIHGN